MSADSTKPGVNLWPISIIGFFIVAIAGCVAFIAFCNTHSVDLVAKDYYEQEVRYQSQMERVQRTITEGAPLSINYSPGSNYVTLTVSKAHQSQGLTGSIHLYRPSAAKEDRTFPLQLNSDGKQTIGTAGLVPGLWKLQVQWTAGGKEYSTKGEIRVGSI